MNITVMGATGRTGSRITGLLLKAGARVRAIGRNEAKLAALASAGAEAMAGDAADAGFLARAFSGADAAYTLLGTDRQAPDYATREAREGEAIAQALRESRVPHVVALSSLGADLNAGTGVLLGLHAQEERLRKVRGTDVLFLHPAAFFENFQASLGFIRQMGFHADAMAADVPVPMVSANDIASAATKALLARGWKGIAVRELLGPRDISYAEATFILGVRIGIPDLHYVQLTYAAMADALVEAGLSRDFALRYVEMARALNEGRVSARRHVGNTTLTRFEDFADELARAGPAS